MALILSIIVPVYNVRPYLEKCVQSLLDQDLDLDEYEVILVDDGSTDGGGELCDRIQMENANIRVIHQANQGLSAARNTGLSAANGKYIQFVDSDDWIESRVLKGLLQKMEDDFLDVLKFGYRQVSESGAFLKETRFSGQSEGADIVQSGASFLLNHLWYTCYACQFILRRDFLVGNQLYFKPGIIFEDVEWTPRVMQIARRVVGLDVIVYDYLMRNSSITNGTDVQKRLESTLERINDLKMQMQTIDDKRWYRGMISQMVVGMLTTVSLQLYDEREYYLDILNKKGVFPLSERYATRKAKRKIRLFNLSPRLACFLIRATNHSN